MEGLIEKPLTLDEMANSEVPKPSEDIQIPVRPGTRARIEPFLGVIIFFE
jgi:hypothetical protein